MFEGYLKPTNKFQPGATRFNGMSMFRGNLMKNGKKVESAETMASGLRRFIAWLTDVCEPEKNDKIVLVSIFFLYHLKIGSSNEIFWISTFLIKLSNCNP